MAAAESALCHCPQDPQGGQTLPHHRHPGHPAGSGRGDDDGSVLAVERMVEEELEK